MITLVENHYFILKDILKNWVIMFVFQMDTSLFSIVKLLRG